MNGTRAILVSPHIDDLRTFARARVLLAFDYDGTLSPIAPTPDRARLPEVTRTLLTRLAEHYSMAVISGRALADISGRVADLGVRQVFGNHGLEWSGGSSPPCPRVRQWVHQLGEQLGGHEGIVVEDKLHSLSVHYRAAADHERALSVILPVVRTLSDARVICGAAAVNLLPNDGANKGDALRRALDLSGCDSAIYVGDDDTDEDAFGALMPEKLLAIRVGPSEASRARYHVESQESIDLLLQTLLEARTRH